MSAVAGAAGDGGRAVNFGRALIIDPAGPAPFEQVRAGFVDLISRGDLLVGQRIPTVRKLAEELGIAPNTVARAYRELEATGVIETRGRNGSFVKTSRDAALDTAQAATLELVKSLRALGIADDAIVSMVTRAVRSS